MGGSGGGGFFPGGRSVDSLKNELKRSIEQTADTEFEIKVSSAINDLLIQYNSRDADLTQKRLDEIKTVIGKEVEGSIDIRFGGSVRKRTHVEGLSDVDSLIFISDPTLSGAGPDKVKAFIKDKLSGALKDAEIEVGTLAITVTYKDGTEIQLLPAIKTASGSRIPNQKGKDWAAINPEAFTNKLSELNTKMEGKAVPTIKLIKAINAKIPAEHQLAGYHIESLAIEAFKGYNGEKIPKSMVEHFFTQAKELVKSPIKDRTGQSVHVDEELGVQNSDKRMAVSYHLDQIHRRLRLADRQKSVSQWQGLLEVPNQDE